MTDKDKITFAIRYLKQGLKSKRTPPLYEELMKELGFVSEKELGKVEGKLADLTSEYYELENLKNNEIAELKAYNEKLLDGDIEKHNKIVELKEKLKPENCLKLLAKEGYIKFTSDKLTYAKTIIQDLLDNTDEYARQKAEDFLKENK